VLNTHYAIGFYAFPIAEYLIRSKQTSPVISAMFGLFSIMSLAASYEIIEWWYAVAEGGNAGIAFLGSQGDVWDAQKDMLCDTLGAVTALLALPFAIRSNLWLDIKPKLNIN
jgi:putative membrane protein